MTGSRPGFLKRMFGGEDEHRSVAPVAAPSVEVKPQAMTSPFGKFGEKGELVGEQIAYFITRLDELYSLRTEFASVAKPMQDFIVSHAEAQTRLAETTALLSRERAELQATRAEAQTLRSGHSQLENALGEALQQIKSHEDIAETRSVQLRHLQIAHDDAASKRDWATRQLAAETQANADHIDARRGLGDDLSRIEQELANERARFAELADQHEATGAETRRLQTLADRLQPSLTTAKRRIAELENDAGATNATIGMLELKLASEQDLRRATELAGSQEKVALENEIATLALQVDALESRHATTTKIFEQSRALVNEKIDQVRQLERMAKELQADKTVSDRRHTVAQEEIRRTAEQVGTLGTRLQDAQERSGMLANAIAAKDAQIEQLEGRSEGLRNQLEDAVARHEEERVGADSYNRKLIEEVQSERAERALAQGALSIARNSREKLLTQLEELKRNRVPRAGELGGSSEAAEREEQSNIHKFRGPEINGDGA